MNAKIKYLFKCASKAIDKQRKECPSCKSNSSTTISRKYFITALRRCDQCQLLFRTPTTTSEENNAFYQVAYSQGFTTDLPDDTQLEKLKLSRFANTTKDYTGYIDCLSAVGAKAGDRLLDFGCSWGYGSWQLKQFGFDVDAFEISQPRCQFARDKMEIRAFHDLSALPDGAFDIFFSSHVLEHVPSVSEVFKLAKQKLKKNGLFVAFTPNGSEAYRRHMPSSWDQLWGMVHPNFLDVEFYRKAFPDALLTSDPYDLESITSFWQKSRQEPLQVNGFELLVVFRMP